MVQVQFASVANLPTILTGVFIPLEDIVPREFDLFLGEPVIDEQ